MQYGQFHSDVDATLITIHQLYPGCGHVVDTNICRESLDEYQLQPDGRCVGLQAPDECAACLMAKESVSEEKLRLTDDAETSLKAARAAVKALVEEHFVATELKFVDAERENYHTRHWQELLKVLGITDAFCSGCGQWHDPNASHDCFTLP